LSDFMSELESLINRHSKENGSDTPDFILAKFLGGVLHSFDETVVARDKWYGRGPQHAPPDVQAELDASPSEANDTGPINLAIEGDPEKVYAVVKKALEGAAIVPMIQHDDLLLTHRVVQDEKEHYRLDLYTPEGDRTAAPIIFHKGSPVGGWHGWTTAHVIKGLISHMDYHQSTKFKCDQNDEIIAHLKEAHKATERRVDERKARGVLYNTEKP
jgi:hypothetical protein